MTHRERERGTAAVELALVLPLLLMLLLSAIDWGWYFFLRGVVASAAREGARVGSVSTAGPGGAQADGQAAAEAYLTDLRLNSGTVVTTTPVVDAGGTPVATVRVQITYPVGSLTGFTFPGYTSLVPADVQATEQMRLEGP